MLCSGDIPSPPEAVNVLLLSLYFLMVDGAAAHTGAPEPLEVRTYPFPPADVGA